MKDLLANRLDKTVFVKSDARAKYGDVVKAVDEVRSAGVDNLGLLTEKNQKKVQLLRRHRVQPARTSSGFLRSRSFLWGWQLVEIKVRCRNRTSFL